MDRIISKLSVQNTDLRYNYLINNVTLGLSLALKHKKVIKNQEVFNRLKSLNEAVKEIPIPTWNGINLDDQLMAYHIGLNALEIIEEVNL